MSISARGFLNDCLNELQSLTTQPCALCAAPCTGEILCAACIADLPRLPRQRCPQCALPTPHGEVCGACLKRPPRFERCRAVFAYAFPVDALVQRLKYASELSLAGFMARQLEWEVAPHPLPDLILPMPLHPRRLGERGFNQSLEIGRILARRLHVPMRAQVCRRIRDTPAQAGLDLKERRRNLRGAFRCEEGLRGMRVALLDDVLTTGASLDELAHAARQAGAWEVEAWVVARTLPP